MQTQQQTFNSIKSLNLSDNLANQITKWTRSECWIDKAVRFPCNFWHSNRSSLDNRTNQKLATFLKNQFSANMEE